MGRDVFGSAGDFVTSPEISQMFGEVRAEKGFDCIVWMCNVRDCVCGTLEDSSKENFAFFPGDELMLGNFQRAEKAFPHCLEGVFQGICVWFPGEELNVRRGARRKGFIRIVWNVCSKGLCLVPWR